MSKRRHAGDWVRLPANAGFVGESDRLLAEIQPEDEPGAPCLGLAGCEDPECREWVTLWTEPDPLCGGKRHMLCHVSECEMMDAEKPVEEP